MTEVKQLDHCPLCLHGEILQYTAARDYMVTGREFGIFRCKQCRLLFTNPVPSQESIEEYYHDDSYISHTNSSRGLIGKIYKVVRSRTMVDKLNLIRKHTGKYSGSILDVGAGTGTFVKTMQSHGWQVQGVEKDAGARKVAHEENQVDLLPSEALFTFNTESLDAITLWHVLEHVYTPDSYMQQFHRLLKNDGTLFLALPNNRSADARLYGKFWAAWDVPRHLYHFNPDSAKWLAANFGFTITDIVPMPYDAYYVSLLSEKYKGTGRMRYLRALYNGWKSNREAGKDKLKTSSLIYVLKKKMPAV